MKQRNWAFIALSTVAVTWFVLSRTVWGPPSKAAADETPSVVVAPDGEDQEISDAQRRYFSNQPRHWRYVMLKRN